MTGTPPTYVSDFHDVNLIKKMPYKKLGKTDMIVSKMSLGCAPLGSIYRKTKEEESEAVVRAALKNGINMIDTSPWYGQGKSESVLGKALQGIPRKAYYLNSKVGRYEKAVEKMFDFRAERVIRSVDESLRLLGAEYLDIVQVHDMEFVSDPKIIMNETLPALQKVKDAKKARYIGITGYPMDNFKSIIDKSSVKIDSILTYCHGSLNDSTLLDYIPYFQKKGIAVINGSILSMGLLTEQGPEKWHPASEEIREACKKAVECCKNQGVKMAKIATHYSLNLPGVDTTLIGTASFENLNENLAVLREGITSLEQTVTNEVVEKFFKPLSVVTWDGVEKLNHHRKLKQIEEQAQAQK